MANVQYQDIVVNSSEQFHLTMQHYVAQGYGPHQMTDRLAILTRPARKHRFGCLIGLSILLFLPLALVSSATGSSLSLIFLLVPVGVIILAVKSNRSASSVTIHIEDRGASNLPPPAAHIAALPAHLQMSEDRESWWDGTRWVETSECTPPMAKRNSAGNLWWDGEQWQSIH